MPRNSSGTYTFPAGANRPVVAGTTVNATAQNALEEDIKSAISDSLSRTGNGGMTVPFKNNDGTLAAPGITFTNETGSGWYRVGANIIAWVIAGAERLRVFATGAKVTGTLEVTGASTLTGAVSAPGGFTGAVTAPAGISTGGAAAPGSAGDINVRRSGAITTAAILLGDQSGGNRWLVYDGTLYQMPGAALVNSAAFVVAGRVTGGTGAIASQTGSVTASGSRSATGTYTVTVAGLTTGGIVVASTSNPAHPVPITVVTVGSGSFGVSAFSLAGAAQNSADEDFSFVVLKL